MPGKVLKPVLADSHCKCDISATDIDAISALKATREHNLDLDSAMKSEQWKRKKEGTKGAFKAPRNRLQRPHIAKYQDVQVDDDGEDIIETDWVADGGSADWPVVHEVPLVDLLKPGKARSRDPPARDFEVIPGASSVIALDDQLIPEPEAVEDDWERLELDDDPDADSAHHAPSYAEVAANR